MNYAQSLNANSLMSGASNEHFPGFDHRHLDHGDGGVDRSGRHSAGQKFDLNLSN